ncbi:MAG: TrkH family potassium uptake protein [Bacteroidales bacterium]|nr:TrkH family potassium uptake protein [Bacteroidales bacterium]
MNFKAISRNVGYALLVSALFMLLSLGVSLLNGRDSAFVPLVISFLITFIVGIFPFLFVTRTSPITLKDGYMIIVLSWLLSFIFGMLPYALWGGPFTLANAWFESVSGYTTTGATILADIEALPKSLLFWRSATHFIGGLGVVVFLLLIIPNASPIKMRLTNMELSSLSRSGYSVRANRTVYVFAYVYLGIFVLSFVSYLLAGMSLFDAVCHAFSVSATGGFSTRNLSIGAFHSRMIELLTMIFMLLSSLHFGLIYMSVIHRTLRPMGNPVIKFYLATLVLMSFACGISLRVGGAVDTLGEGLWQGAFQALCTSSTTGFAIADNATWPMFANVLLLSLAIMCGCAGSTSGGVKADRILVLFKMIGCQIARTLHPSSMYEVHLGDRVLRENETSPHILYIAVFTLLTGISILLNLAIGLNAQDAFSSSIAALSNLGPATGRLGTMGNYDFIPAASKFLLSLDMFLGRVEIYPVVAVVAMLFDWKKK